MKKQKTIVQRYGKLAAMGLILLLGVVGVYQFIDYQKTKSQEMASSHFDKMLGFSKVKDYEHATLEANILIKEYAKTPYAELGAFMLAKIALVQDKPKEAIDALHLAINLNKKGPLQDIARIRLARLLSSEGQLEEALNILPKEVDIESKGEGKDEKDQAAMEQALLDSPYATLFEEIRGDIYFKQNNLKKAKEAYARALTSAPPGIPLTATQLKYNDISVKEDS